MTLGSRLHLVKLPYELRLSDRPRLSASAILPHKSLDSFHSATISAICAASIPNPPREAREIEGRGALAVQQFAGCQMASKVWADGVLGSTAV